MEAVKIVLRMSELILMECFVNLKLATLYKNLMLMDHVRNVLHGKKVHRTEKIVWNLNVIR